MCRALWLEAASGAGRDSKPFKTKSEVLEYRANQGDKAKTLYKGRVFSIKASCPNASDGALITYTARTDWFKREFTVRPDGFTGSNTSGSKGQSSSASWEDGIGELVAFDPRLRKVATVDFLFHHQDPGRAARGLFSQCVWAGIVTEVGPRDLITGKTSEFRELDPPDPWQINLECTFDSPVVDGAEGGEAGGGKSLQPGTVSRQRFYSPLDQFSILFGNTGAVRRSPTSATSSVCRSVRRGSAS